MELVMVVDVEKVIKVVLLVKVVVMVVLVLVLKVEMIMDALDLVGSGSTCMFSCKFNY